jgi:hypothetical protein
MTAHRHPEFHLAAVRALGFTPAAQPSPGDAYVKGWSRKRGWATHVRCETCGAVLEVHSLAKMRAHAGKHGVAGFRAYKTALAYLEPGSAAHLGFQRWAQELPTVGQS